MHKFICTSVGGKIVPQRTSKQPFFLKLLGSYESLNKKFLVTIQVLEKEINEQQITLYNAFILRAADHFGNSFVEMQNLLVIFHPPDIHDGLAKPKPVTNWTTSELNIFIHEASAHLAEQGFIF